jgi:hypothetical protein
MSLVFEHDMPELKTDDGKVVPDSTAKFVLLALADHANDEGEGAYPGVKRICKKTSMSSQTVCNALNALRHNDYTVLQDGKSKSGTNNYTINVSKFQPIGFHPLESGDSTHKNSPIPATRVKPSINHPVKPSKKKEGASAKPAQPPEIVLFKEVVKHYPKTNQRETVIDAIQKVNARLGRVATLEDLSPWFTEWGKVSGNEWSLKWLDWAVAGQTDRANGNGKNKPNLTDIFAEYARENGISYGN